MPLVQVRHGLIRYQAKNSSGVMGARIAFRGMTVELPKGEYDRLYPHGAVIPADDELERGGEMIALPNTASDEELIAWVSVASRADIAAEIAERPHLADRLLAAADIVKERLQAQNELLGGLQGTIDDGLKQAAEREALAADDDGLNDDGTVRDPDADAGADEITEPGDDLAEVVAGNVKSISAYLSEHPNKASAVMDAENALASKDDRAVREGVIKAVTAAAQHAGQ